MSTNRVMELSIPLPSERLLIDAEALRDGAADMKIATVDKFLDAQLMLVAVKSKIKALVEERMDITRPIDESKKRIIALYARPLEFLEQAKGALDSALLDFDRAEKNRAREAQVKADAAAEVERNRLMNLAEKAGAAGNASKMEMYEERANRVVAPYIPKEAPLAPGVSYRDVWKFRIVDPKMIGAPFMMPDEIKIGATVRALKDLAPQIIGTGLEVYCEQVIATRSVT